MEIAFLIKFYQMPNSDLPFDSDAAATASGVSPLTSAIFSTT